jgi:hypothetical protein
MATIDRIEPNYVPWSPSTSGYATTDAGTYLGRHRRPTTRGFSLHRMFYTARHRRR